MFAVASQQIGYTEPLFSSGDDLSADADIIHGGGNEMAWGGYYEMSLTPLTLDGAAGNDTLFGDFNWDAGPAPNGETENERLIRVGLEGQYHGNELINGGKRLPANDAINRRTA